MPDAQSVAIDRPTLTDQQREWLTSARDLLDFIEVRPELIPANGAHIVTYCTAAEEFSAAVKALGACAKAGDDYFARATRSFGDLHFPHQLVVSAHRGTVCERHVLGFEEVEEPDADAVAALPTRTVQREVVEWRCDSWLDPAQEADGAA